MYSEHKQQIAAAFGRAAHSYDDSAAFQRRVGHALLSRIPEYERPLKVLDLGCGTGYFSAQWLKIGHSVTCADLSQGMLDKAAQRCGQEADYCLADAEALPFDDNQFDIAFSSLALQWCDDLSIPLRELRRVVKPGGIIAFTTLAAGSLHELHTAWQRVDGGHHVNRFLSIDALTSAVTAAGLAANDIECLPIVQHYREARQLMRDLKGIGANHIVNDDAPIQRGLGGRQRLARVEAEYEAFRNKDGLLPATYQVLFGVIVNE